MVKLKHMLTVDDLIVKYMIVKVELGYEPSYTIDEFISFLKYFTQYKEVNDVTYDGNMLFDRFFERKKNDWMVSLGRDKVFVPHIERVNDDLIISKYNLSCYDDSVINVYFMSRDEKIEIVNLIINFLKDKPKRNADTSIDISKNSLMVGESISALFVNLIWEQYVKEKVLNRCWPQQCRNIHQYLFDMDLAEIINLSSIKGDLLQFYKNISKRISVLIEKDPSLMIRSIDSSYLAYANYRYIMEGYEELLYRLCLDCSFEVRVADNIFLVNYDKYDRYSASVGTKLDDDKTKKLVRTINKNIKSL